MLDSVLHTFVTMNSLSSNPAVLIVMAFAGAYFGSRIVEVIPFTRRIIERREAQAAERQ
jgi:hypothetical protein